MTDTKQICEAIKTPVIYDTEGWYIKDAEGKVVCDVDAEGLLPNAFHFIGNAIATAINEHADLKARLADANRGAQVNALVNESLAKKLKLAVEALSDARSHLFAIYNGDWPSDISPTPTGFAQFAVNDIDATLAKIKEPSKGRDV